MVLEDHALASRTKSGCQTLAFCFVQYNAAKVLIYSLCITVEICDVLVDHFQFLAKCTPRLSAFAMAVASGMYIWSSFVNCRVYQEPRCIGWTCLIPPDDLPVVVYQDHITSLECREVLP